MRVVRAFAFPIRKSYRREEVASWSSAVTARVEVGVPFEKMTEAA